MYQMTHSVPVLVLSMFFCLCIGRNIHAQAVDEESPGEDSIQYTLRADRHSSILLKGIQGHLRGVEANKVDMHPFENPAEALKGRMPGIHVSSWSGHPGADPSIQIRGLNTFLFNHDPVILLDGTPITRISDINFNDVASVEVVKDMATASMFGGNAANGVVLITTRTGGPGKNTMKFSASYGMESLAKTYGLLNGSQSFSYMRELNQPLLGTVDDKSVDWGNDWISGSLVNTSDLGDYDQQDALFRTAARQDYSLSFSGGTEKTTFLVNGSYYYQEGIVNPADFSRFTFSFNLDHRINRKLEFGTRIYYTNSRQRIVNTAGAAEEGNVILSALASPPFLPVEDNITVYYINPMRPEIDNTQANINGIRDNDHGNHIASRFYGNWNIINGLTLQLNASANLGLDRRKMYRRNDYTYLGRINQGMGLYQGVESTGWNFEPLLSYGGDFGEHHLDLLGGFNLYSSRYAWNRTLGTIYPTNDVTELNNASSKLAASNLFNFSKTSFLGRLRYDFADKYFFHAALRADGSTRYSNSFYVKADPIKPEDWKIEKDRKYGTYYGAGLAWRISEESFLQNSSAISNLNLRLSYGVAGNDGGYHTGREYPQYWTDTVPVFNPDEDLIDLLLPGVGFRLRNLQLQEPEKVAEMNVGLDLGLLDDRISLTADYYLRTMTGLVMPDFSDTTFMYGNLGEHGSSGFEANLTTLNISSDGFTWTSNLNFTFLHNQVSGLGGQNNGWDMGYEGNSNIILENEALYSFWGYQTEGVFQNQQEVDNNASLPGAGPGDIRYSDLNGDNIIDDRDKTILGDPQPDFYFGFNNILRMDDFELSFLLQGAYGQEILNLTRMQTEGLHDFINLSHKALERWTGEGTSNEIPRAYPGNLNGNNNVQISDRLVENGSYLRLKHLTLAYFLPARVAGKMKMSDARIYLTAQNLLTISPYGGYDPEVSSYGPLGIDYGAYPQARFIGAGISFGF